MPGNKLATDLKGSPFFMSPTLRKWLRKDIWTTPPYNAIHFDIWSYGILLVQALCGKRYKAKRSRKDPEERLVGQELLDSLKCSDKVKGIL